MAETKEEIIELLKHDLEKLIVRNYIRIVFPNYNNDETYIVYDGHIVEIYRKEVLGFKKAMNQTKSYLISYPVRII